MCPQKQKLLQFISLLLFSTSLYAQDPDPHASYLADPVRIKVDGEIVDTRKEGGHAGAIVYDYDKDGLPDLMITSFNGHIRFCKNVGTRSKPQYTDKGWIKAEGQPLRINNW